MSNITDKEPFILGDQALLTLVIYDSYFDPAIDSDVDALLDLTGRTVSVLFWVANSDGSFTEYSTLADSVAAATELESFTLLDQTVDATKGRAERQFATDDFATAGSYRFRLKLVTDGDVQYGTSSYYKEVVAP